MTNLLIRSPNRTRRRQERSTARSDTVLVLTIVLALAFLLPARLVFPPLGAAGRPALLASLALLLLWMLGILARTAGSSTTGRRQPIWALMFLFSFAVLLTYGIALTRLMTGIEQRASDRFLLLTLGLVGLTLFVADRIQSVQQLDVLLRRLTYLGAALSLLGLVEFLVGVNIASYVRVPGLALNAELAAGLSRGDFGRIAATATHPIEFGVVLGMILPLAVHYALNATPSLRTRSIAVAMVIAAGIPLPVARSSLIAAASGMLVLSTAWSWRRRLNAAAIALVGMVAYAAMVPGLLGTLRGLFLNAPTDGSVQVRVDDYGPAFEYISDRPWFGLGPGTFLPSQYRQLDNQVLKFALEMGLVGLFVMAVVLFGGFAVAMSVSYRAESAEHRSRARALAGGIIGGILVCFTFDSFTYQIYATVLFLYIGASGALWRLGRGPRPSALPSPGWMP